MPHPVPNELTPPDLHAALAVSYTSLVWTLIAGAAAIALGVLAHSVAFMAFGAVGILDAAGSACLIRHFHLVLGHGATSPRPEQVALRVITVGMAAVGLAAVATSMDRLFVGSRTSPQVLDIALAVVSLVALSALALRKQRVARRIASHALRSDGWLSAIGAVLALLTLAGSALQVEFGWWWIDSGAAIGVGLGAIGLSLALARGGTPRGGRATRGAQPGK
ncbi:MAG: hypothetical protein ACRDJU_09415 [Actinomycetota bacterium]